MLKVHVQSKVRKKSNTHCYWLLSFVLGVEQYSDCKIELPQRFPPLAYQLNLQSIIHRNHFLLLSISTKMVLITQHLITLCIIEESLDMICHFPTYLPCLYFQHWMFFWFLHFLSYSQHCKTQNVEIQNKELNH